ASLFHPALHTLYRTTNLAGGIVQNHDQVIPALVLKPSVPAALDVQQHAGQRPPWTPLAMHPALAPPRHQSCPLQGLLHPAVAEFDLMLIAELLMKMPHVQMVKRHLVCKPWTIEKADENSNGIP